ncbi:hypothetical protein [uncultured Bacteroides sp.]|uniref:hypothetical protein n=1 Tax=uncultured Bacteroides sp. TaxID=162156 RepID=UPI002599D152|nr:hypothetical protein [uncultured Bacteroides sp.]
MKVIQLRQVKANVLAFSEDNDLEDGLSFSNMVTDDKGYAREIVYGRILIAQIK